MKESMNESELEKMRAILRYAPVGLVEIDQQGKIFNINIKGDELLGPIFRLTNSKGNLFPALSFINEELTAKIKNASLEDQLIFQDIYTFKLEEAGELATKHYSIVANVQVDQSVMVSFDDFTERRDKDDAMHEAETEKAVEQGKYEIASDVLHDIGNAIVGFGSYLTRIKRSVQNSNIERLQQLSGFFADKKEVLITAFGEPKAVALVDMLNGITDGQQTNLMDIQNAVTEQLKIISHIQEILNIQRQYVKGESKKRKPVNFRSIINDCMAMLFASYDKRGIDISLNLADDVPTLNGDRTKLMQVILNVLKNSLDAIEDNTEKKQISVDLYKGEAEITIAIKDSGAGFDQITAAKIFERGFTTKESGTGIGLYNCKNIIEGHSGTIEIKSNGIGEGSETLIKFYLDKQPSVFK